MKRAIKFFHSLAGIGFAGGLAAYMLVLNSAPDIAATADYAAMRGALNTVASWMIMPSMLLAVTSGLLAMALHYPFHETPWVWVKAGTGLLIFEASLMSIDAPAERAANAAARAVNGEIDTATLVSLVSDEWKAMWTLLVLAVLNVLLAIWRPRLWRGATPESDESKNSA
ncbi:MAG: hypothetical protein AB8G16_05875 [Gammaproteobacteria bacterium]